MNVTPASQKAASFFGILGAFLVVGLLVFIMSQSSPAPALNAARIQQRTNALAELRNVSAKGLESNDWLDPVKKLVRLKITRAMELTVEEYRNPAAARTNLIARAEKANEPPPKPPEQPSKYE